MYLKSPLTNSYFALQMGWKNIDFEKGDGLVPAIVQDWRTKSVLMLGYMNVEAIKKSEESGRVTFFSRSKQRLWTKGETSGNYLILKEIKQDCDHDALLVLAEPLGVVCHTGEETCFGENDSGISFLEELQRIIADRKENPKEGSYTTSLFNKGVNKIAQKVGEEAVELVIEAKDNNDHLFINEAADLLYHYMILLEERGMNLKEIVGVLESRHSQKKS